MMAIPEKEQLCSSINYIFLKGPIKAEQSQTVPGFCLTLCEKGCSVIKTVVHIWISLKPPVRTTTEPLGHSVF